jgi:hypothetical protein
MMPEKKFELLRILLESGVEVRTYYRNKRVAALERATESYVVIRYEDGSADRLRMATFGRRRFVAVI